ncbi:S49 family peptidase [Burkholderiaceae bacterium DAT-1]|nr:S49 family peptidase [Burkholderiaceae bacterium DAT-1]
MNEQQSPGWEKEVLEKLVLASLKEQRAARNWGIFFKFLTFGFLFLILILIFGAREAGDGETSSRGPHTAVVELNGVIAAGNDASAERINEGLRAAFKDHNTKGVILKINSPGGSPVQAGQINDEIRRLKAQYPKIPLFVAVEDICASGGYYVAVAADKIFVDKASLVGSIGVLMDGFGFTGVMDKLGVERRLVTAGSNKGFLDPFSPQNPQQLAYARDMLAQIHQQFIKVVKEGRGKRLKDDPELFSGLVWNGEKSVALGLADGFASTDVIARDMIHAEELVDYTPRPHWAERFAKSIGAEAGTRLGAALQVQLK